MAAIVIILIVLAVLYLLLTWGMFQVICRRFDGKFNPLAIIGEATNEALKPYAEQVNAGIRWTQEHPSEEVEITSFDGLKLKATYFHNPDAKAVMIACHGYRGSGPRDFSSACNFYHNHGMSLLLIDQRANGRSEGKYITFGIRERRDIRDWCVYMQNRFPEKPILLVGISMGATGVLMSAPDLPENVRCLVADCGFVSPWDELDYVLRHYLHIPGAPFLWGINLWCRLLGGFGLREYTTETALRENTRPIFFIHGEKDDFVPCTNSHRNVAVCAAPYVLFTVPEAGHGMSYLVDYDGYVKKFYEFLDMCQFPRNEIH